MCFSYQGQFAYFVLVFLVYIFLFALSCQVIAWKDSSPK